MEHGAEAPLPSHRLTMAHYPRLYLFSSVCLREQIINEVNDKTKTVIELRYQPACPLILIFTREVKLYHTISYHAISVLVQPASFIHYLD